MKPLLVLLTVSLLSFTGCGSGTGAVSTGRGPSHASVSTQQTSLNPQDINHISTYGNEAAEPDRREIVALVNRYYAAAAADDGAKACSMIYSLLAGSIAEDYGQPPGPPYLRGKTCGVVMSKLFKHVPGQPSAVLAATKVTGVRLLPRQGFVQLSSKAMPTGEIFVQRQGNSWKIGALIGKECVKCSAQASDSRSIVASSDQSLQTHLKSDNDDDENGEEVGHLDSDNDADLRSDRQNENGSYLDGDDGHISGYGQLAEGAEEEVLTAIAKRYLAAAAAGDGATACSLIDPAIVKTVPEDYGRAPGPAYMRGETCATVMSGLFRHSHRQFDASMEVTGVRVNGNVAYVLLGSKRRPASYMTIERMQDIWEMVGLVVTPLP